MAHLDALRLRPTPRGYDFVLQDEVLGGCELAGARLTRFEVAGDQRRRGVGRRAMALLLDALPPDVRLEIEIPAGDHAAEAFAEAVGFGVRARVYDRAVRESGDTVELFRPVGQQELDLIRAAGMRAFPPRLPDQPIF